MDAVVEPIFSRFARSEPHQRDAAVAAHHGLGRRRARDDQRSDVLDQLGDDATGVFILDETRRPKRGTWDRPRRVDPIIGQRICRLPPLWDRRVASRGTTDSSAEMEQVIALAIRERCVPEGPISGMCG
ncbi:hypothetical protein [Amycolatopsis anabasis]|uniref:hypothetical protein n=1 Tax=Amycolatopsis anabasis TaxID=1840409 RepID=UPI00131C0BEC|nr:hypothetical protein [Amycolatopsis anabasis]